MLHIESLSKSYSVGSGIVQAVRDISFSVKDGERIGIAGGSGSGKSTVLRLIAGLETPTTGRITLFGTPIMDTFPTELYTRVQVMFQNSLSIMMPRMTIGEFLKEPYRNFEIGVPQEIENWLNAVNIPVSVLSKYPHQLSGGQLQRVALARVLSVRPDLILFDEPTSALDVINQRVVIDIIQDMYNKRPFGYLFVSHDIGLLQSITDRILVMKDGSIVEDIPSNQLLDAKHSYTRALVEASR